MRTNIEIDDKLLAKYMKVTKTSTKKEAVHLALSEDLKRRTRTNKKIFELWGSNLITDDYDPRPALVDARS
jgi:Arc/MetJ family transcription regulator